MKNVWIVLAVILFLPALSDGGWLSDKLKKSGESIADRLIDDATDATYDKTREETEEVFEEDRDDQQAMEEDEEPPWAETQPKKSKTRRSDGTIRTDLHFSADTRMTDPENIPESMQGKMYVDGTRMRIDMSSSEGSMSTIVTGSNPDDKIYSVIHDQKMYMAATVADTDEDMWSGLSVEGNPCIEYRQGKKIGSETLIGRSVVKWECSDPEDSDLSERITLWLDKKLKIPLRYQESDGSSYEVTRLSEGSPPGHIFQVPAGYRAFSMGNFGN